MEFFSFVQTLFTFWLYNIYNNVSIHSDFCAMFYIGSDFAIHSYFVYNGTFFTSFALDVLVSY